MYRLRYTTVIYFPIFHLLLVFGAADVNPNDTDYQSVKRLRTKLFTSYDKNVRPIQDNSNTTSVNFTFAFVHGIEYNERNETMTIEGFFRLKWIDPRWTWNPSEYGGLDFISVESDEAWLPEIGIYESVPAQTMTSILRTRPMVQPQGLIIWSPRGVLKTHCPFKAEGYPEDTQVCNMTFGSWGSDGLTIDLQVDGTYVYQLRNIGNENKKWKFPTYEIQRVVNYMADTGKPFVNVIVSVRFQRRPPVENKVVTPPVTVAIIMMLSMFWLPPSSQKKLTVGATALFMQLGLLLYIAASVNSPVVISTAVSPIRSVIFITITALLSEIVVIIISKLMMSPPPSLKNLVDGNFGKILILNAPNKPVIDEELQIQEISGPENTWYKTAMAADRLFFVVFIVITVINQIS